jgi:hypothetical protein
MLASAAPASTVEARACAAAATGPTASRFSPPVVVLAPVVVVLAAVVMAIAAPLVATLSLSPDVAREPTAESTTASTAAIAASTNKGRTVRPGLLPNPLIPSLSGYAGPLPRHRRAPPAPGTSNCGQYLLRCYALDVPSRTAPPPPVLGDAHPPAKKSRRRLPLWPEPACRRPYLPRPRAKAGKFVLKAGYATNYTKAECHRACIIGDPLSQPLPLLLSVTSARLVQRCLLAAPRACARRPRPVLRLQYVCTTL